VKKGGPVRKGSFSGGKKRACCPIEVENWISQSKSSAGGGTGLGKGKSNDPNPSGKTKKACTGKNGSLSVCLIFREKIQEKLGNCSA